jgi:hypothetical protein
MCPRRVPRHVSVPGCLRGILLIDEIVPPRLRAKAPGNGEICPVFAPQRGGPPVQRDSLLMVVLPKIARGVIRLESREDACVRTYREYTCVRSGGSKVN